MHINKKGFASDKKRDAENGQWVGVKWRKQKHVGVDFSVQGQRYFCVIGGGKAAEDTGQSVQPLQTN